MIFNELPNSGIGAKPVRMLAIGKTAAHFAKALKAGAAGPLADMLAHHPKWRKPEDLSETIRTFDYEGLAFLFIVVGLDATDFEVGQAVVLARRASEFGAFTIGAFVMRPHFYTSRNRPRQPGLLWNFLADLMDARIEDLSDDSAHDMNAVRWFVGTLQTLTHEGVLILEPAWDLHDIAEVLDLPGARLTLLTCTVEMGKTAVTAVTEALLDLKERGIELELASGVLMVVWQGPPHRLTVQQVSGISRIVRDALGRGGQLLVLTAGATVAPQQSAGKGACATLVVSHGSQHTKLGNWP